MDSEVSSVWDWWNRPDAAPGNSHLGCSGGTLGLVMTTDRCSCLSCLISLTLWSCLNLSCSRAMEELRPTGSVSSLPMEAGSSGLSRCQDLDLLQKTQTSPLNHLHIPILLSFGSWAVKPVHGIKDQFSWVWCGPNGSTELVPYLGDIVPVHNDVRSQSHAIHVDAETAELTPGYALRRSLRVGLRHHRGMGLGVEFAEAVTNEAFNRGKMIL
ncbi:hypothetical protein MUK42_34547 [Musa troglodytarum]|uniref:Uncharacterized protein n=1 Tax=Musa troglodytarum TaxID=320322 RepID=A0A9E7KBI1_9LILI|nr:hypothetical protein MUK42_34547 [Musa troglodytarum]